MNIRDELLFRDIMSRYKEQWDRNAYARDNYDDDLEYYRGYRNPTDYPLAYNENFNRILPIIQTLLSRFMDQLYQGSNIVSVKPRKKANLNSAKAVENVLNFQLENLNNVDMQGGSFLTMFKWFFNAITFGKGICKCYWRKEDRITPKRIMMPKPAFDRFGRMIGMDTLDVVSQEMQTIYDGPYVEVLHNKLFIPHPEYKDIQQMPQVFIVYRKSVDEVMRKAKDGTYKNLGELGFGGGGAGGEELDSREAFVRSLYMEGGCPLEETRTDYKSPMVDIIECYGKFILEEEPYEVGSGIQIKGKEEETIAHIGNYKTILSLQRNTYGCRPIFDIGCYYHPELYWDLGLVQLTKGIQEQVNNLANLRIQNVMMQINQMLKVNVDSDIDPKALVWKPFGIIPVENMDDVQPLTVPDYHSNLFMEQEMFYKNTIQDIMGMYDYNMGATPQRQERVGVVYGIQAMGEARAKLMLMSMDHLGIRPLLKYMMLLNSYHLPSGYEYRVGDAENMQFGNIWGKDINPDYDFAARYTSMEPALGKQARLERLIQLAGMWKDSPWINQYQWNKTIMELSDIQESEYLLKKPQQLEQERAQAMKQQQDMFKMQMIAEQQKKNYETQGKLTVSRQDFQEDKALSEQEFQQDMVLEALKQEAVSEKSD